MLPALALISASPSLAQALPAKSEKVEIAAPVSFWIQLTPEKYAELGDDDIVRHLATPDYFGGLSVSEQRISENGFNWQLVRFENTAKPTGPLWVVPHDSENAAFDSMVHSIRKYGGRAIAVNTANSKRKQEGHGTCGHLQDIEDRCDPNRNFSEQSPKYTAAFLNERIPGQPVIAIHTNHAGFEGDGNGGDGEITLLDTSAPASLVMKARPDAFFGNGSFGTLANPDSFGLQAYSAANEGPDPKSVACRNALNAKGVNFWHERVEQSDSSMSQYLLKYFPEVLYFNAEGREEQEIGVASARHIAIIDAFMSNCVK